MSRRDGWRRVEGGLAGLAGAFATTDVDERRDDEADRLAAAAEARAQRKERAASRARARDETAPPD